MNIVEHTSDNIETQITLLSSFLKVFTMRKIRMWFDNENLKENVVDNVGIRCSSCEKNWFISEKYQLKKHDQ